MTYAEKWHEILLLPSLWVAGDRKRTMIMQDPIHINEEMAETIIAFVKKHEREEISDEMWEVVMFLQNELEQRY